MNKTCEVPLHEQLRRVPNDHRLEIEHNPTSHSMIPVGVLCHKAAEKLESLTELKNISEGRNSELTQFLSDIIKENEAMQSKIEIAHREAKTLALSLYEQHYQKENPTWQIQNDTVGIILQISNMVAGMEKTKRTEESICKSCIRRSIGCSLVKGVNVCSHYLKEDEENTMSNIEMDIEKYSEDLRKERQTFRCAGCCEYYLRKNIECDSNFNWRNCSGPYANEDSIPDEIRVNKENWTCEKCNHTTNIWDYSHCMKCSAPKPPLVKRNNTKENNINKLEISIEKQISVLCHAIETLPASESQTKLSIAASNLNIALKDYIKSTGDILNRLGKYNPPDRTNSRERQTAQDILDAANEIEKLRKALRMAHNIKPFTC